MQIDNWNTKTYQEFINYLISIKDDKYCDFNSRICRTKYKMLGIRLPDLRNIAKKIIRTNFIILLY